MRNKNIITKTTQFLFAVALYSSSSLVHSSTNPDIDKGKNALIDKMNIIFSEQSENKPGLSVLVRKNDQVIFKRSKGIANKHKNISIESHTGFRIGSISKPFTALAIMQLVEQGKLSLDDSVTQFFTELPSSWNDITIKHLLSHRVNISSDFFSDSNIDIANRSTNQDVIKFLSSKKIRARSLSTKHAQYCNSCFVLLAEIIPKVSGIGFTDYLNKNIFIPANMKNTYIVEQGVSLNSNDALNYAKTVLFQGIMQYTTGAMAQVSSVDDLNNFIIALKQHKIISQKTLNLMTTVHSNSNNDGAFGLGWMIGWGDKPFFSHGGSQDGYQSELFFHPKYDLEIVILTNGGNDTYDLQGQLLRTIITHFKSLLNEQEAKQS